MFPYRVVYMAPSCLIITLCDTYKCPHGRRCLIEFLTICHCAYEISIHIAIIG